jgi:hypothetical protein
VLSPITYQSATVKYFFYLSFFLVHAFSIHAQSKVRLWTGNERQTLLVGLDTTEANLRKEVMNLTAAQLHFKPDSSQWSVAELLEHLGVYEELLYWDLLNGQYTPEMPELAKKVKGVDSIMVAYTNDPVKLKAPFVGQPLGRFQTTAELMDYFSRFRNAVMELVKTTPADFRQHFVFRSEDAGVWHIRDLQQYTLLWIAHTTRHANQIRRVKAAPDFPR